MDFLAGPEKSVLTKLDCTKFPKNRINLIKDESTFNPKQQQLREHGAERAVMQLKGEDNACNVKYPQQMQSSLIMCLQYNGPVWASFQVLIADNASHVIMTKFR